MVDYHDIAEVSYKLKTHKVTSSWAGPVDDERQRPLDDVVEGEGLQPGEGGVRGVRVGDGLLLLGLDGEDPQQLSDDVVRHEVDLRRTMKTGRGQWGSGIFGLSGIFHLLMF